jgi:hypothetical protein
MTQLRIFAGANWNVCAIGIALYFDVGLGLQISLGPFLFCVGVVRDA